MAERRETSALEVNLKRKVQSTIAVVFPFVEEMWDFDFFTKYN